MADPVACKQCGLNYDPAANAFCPRCGSTSQGAAPSPVTQAIRRHDPGRRRVQASGAVLAVVGGLLALLFVPMLFLSTGFMSRTIDDVTAQEPELRMPGGEVRLVASRAGVAAAGLQVNVSTPVGTPVANGTTDAEGRFNASLGEHAFVVVAVTAPEGNFTRRAAALDGDVTTVRLDVAADDAESRTWAGLGPMLRLMRIALGILIGAAALLAAGGIAALRLRGWGLAVAGPAVTVSFVLVLFVASLNVGALLILLVLGIPLAIIARGRRHFGDGQRLPPGPPSPPVSPP